MLLRSEHSLPVTLGESEAGTILKTFKAIKVLPAKNLALDWGRTQGLTPAGHAMLACLFDEMVENQIPVSHLHLTKKLKTVPVIANLYHVGDYKVLPKPSVHDSEGHDYLLGSGETALNVLFLEKVSSKFADHLDEDLEFACRLIINELMQNAVDHSTSERYYLYAGVAGQDFHIGVLDRGVTLPAKLEQKYTLADDREYLAHAFLEGVSTRRQRPGGLGLSHTFDLVKDSGGTLIMMSRNAQIRRYFRNRKVVRGLLRYPLHGTWCFVRFPLKGRR